MPKITDVLELSKYLQPTSVLLSKRQMRLAKYAALKHGVSHKDRSKIGDLLGFVLHAEAHLTEGSTILDAGSGAGAHLAKALISRGFRSVYTADLLPLHNASEVESSRHFLGSLNDPKLLGDQKFDAIYSLSVIEHLHDPVGAIINLSRNLESGGYLMFSTDYWAHPINTSGIYPYGEDMPEMKIFTRDELMEMVSTLENHGFILLGQFDGVVDELCCYWRRVDRAYTFARLAFMKTK